MNYVYFLLFSLTYFSINSKNELIYPVMDDVIDEKENVTDDNIFFPMLFLYGFIDSHFLQIGGTDVSITQNFTVRITHFDNTPTIDYWDEKTGIIIIIEVLKTRPDEICMENDILINHLDRGSQKLFLTTQICDKLTYTTDKKYGKYVNVSEDARLNIRVNLKNFLGTVKITATSTRIGHKIKCKRKSEISCQIGGKTWCIMNKLECNGELNCGDRNQSDENPEICHHHYQHRSSRRDKDEFVVMALHGIILVIIVSLILVEVIQISSNYTPQPLLSNKSNNKNVLLMDLESCKKRKRT